MTGATAVRAPVPRRELAAVAALALAYVAALAARTDPLLPGHPDWLRPWDHQKYLAMAEGPFALRTAPFSWRVLEPLLVHVSPLGTATSFGLLAVGAVSGTIVAVHVLLRRLGFRPLLAWAGTLAFCSLGWVTGYPLYNIWLPDALAGLAVVLAAIAALDRRAVRFTVLLAVGVLAKEQVLLAAPLWYTFGLAEPGRRPDAGQAGGRARALLDHRLLAQVACLAAPAVVALVAVRLALPRATPSRARWPTWGWPRTGGTACRRTRASCSPRSGAPGCRTYRSPWWRGRWRRSAPSGSWAWRARGRTPACSPGGRRSSPACTPSRYWPPTRPGWWRWPSPWR